jgi:hypothetical protein
MPWTFYSATGQQLKSTVVTTSQISDDAVTLAKMAGGTDGNLITYDTSGNPAYVATGTANQVLTSNGADTVPTFQAAPSVVTRVGGQTTESTTTSTSVVDLISIGSLSIAVTDPIKFCISTKKSTGGASAVAFGFKLNTTACVLAVAGSNSLIGHTTANEAQMAYGVYEIAPRYNNYQSFTGIYTVTNTSAVMRAQAVGPLGNFNAFSPVAVITDFKITAISTSGVTAACGLLQVYNFTG